MQTASGDPRASETALELQLEGMDGVPGNTTFREVFDQATSLLRKRTDSATQIATILGRVADIQTSPDGFVRFGPDVAAETIEEIAEEIRLIDGRNAWVFGNEMYINSSNSSALEAVAKLKLAIDIGADRNTRQNLLEDIIAATSRGSGDRRGSGEAKREGKEWVVCFS